MDKNLALTYLITLTNDNIGFIPSSPVEFNDLISRIKKKTDRDISLSSIKRLWGYVTYESFPSITTLNILAQFNGFSNWDSFMVSCRKQKPAAEDSAFIENMVIATDKLSAGDRLCMAWTGEKSCELVCLSHQRFKVSKSHNIKLLAGDTLTLHTVCVGLPLFASDIKRGNLHLPAYIGAKKSGITEINLIRKSE